MTGTSRSTRTVSWLAAIAMAGMTGAAWGAEPVKLGLVGPLTGPAANTGLTVRATYELLAKQVNEAGGIEIDGEKRLLEIITTDSESKPSVGVSAGQRLLTRDNVDILVGDLLHSDVTLALMELAPAFPEKLVYAPLAVSSSISQRIADEPEKYGNVWKWDGDSEAYAVSVASFLDHLIESGARSFPDKTIAFVSEETDYARTILNGTVTELESRGWNVVANENVPIGHSDFFPQLSKLRSLQPEVTLSIFTAASSGVAYVRQVREQGYESEQLQVYYNTLPAFIEGAGADTGGMIGLANAFDPVGLERGREFAELMRSADITVSGDAVLGYCSGQVLVDVLKRAGSLDIEKLNEAFLQTDDDTCANYVRIVFDPERHSPKLGPDYFFFAAMQFPAEGGKPTIVWPEKSATGELN